MPVVIQSERRFRTCLATGEKVRTKGRLQSEVSNATSRKQNMNQKKRRIGATTAFIDARLGGCKPGCLCASECALKIRGVLRRGILAAGEAARRENPRSGL